MTHFRAQIAGTLAFLVSVCSFVSALAQSNGVLREVYSNIGGTIISDLTSHASFPDNPSSENITANFEAPTDVADNYGQRLRALLVPPVTGAYVFWIASDDASQLFLSTDDTPALKQQIAGVTAWTSSREYNKEPNQRSGSIPLVAGNRYYIEALMKEGIGGDNLAVTWQKPGDPVPGNGAPPIPGTSLLPYGLGPPIITGHPTNVTVAEGGSATFTVRLGRSLGAISQWLRNGTNIPGATSSSYSLGPVGLTDNSTFRCFVSNSFGSTNSNTATLTVLPDTTPPTISSVVNLGDNEIVTVVFSEPVEQSSATQTANYAINNGVMVTAASLGDDLRTVVLSTTPLSAQVTYTLTVNNVRDRASSPNTIAPNSQRSFSLNFTPLDVGIVMGTPEPIGPSTRRTGLTISEIMYHPTNRPDGRNLEFVELYNSNPWSENIGGYRLSGEIDYTFPSNTTIGALSYMVVAAVPADIQAVYGISSARGPFTNVLSNGSGMVRLRDRQNAVLVEAIYSEDPPYPASADGGGHSLVLWRPSYGEGNPKAWAASDIVGGSPGAAEITRANPYRTVVLNEFLAHTDDPALDFIELYNYSASPVNIGGCILTDDATTNKFVVAAGTSIPARGFVSFNQNQLGFALSAEGETIYFKNTNGTKVLDAIKYGDQENGVSTGRYPDGAPGFHRLATTTPGAANARLLLNDVVINEIMFNPISRDNDDEFIELYNRGTNAVDLSKWRLRGGITYTFPNNTILSPNSYLIVADDAARLMTNYPALSSANTLGNFSGNLGNGGDRISLDKPEDVVSTNEFGVLVTNKIHIVVDDVTYEDGGRWTRFADGGGSSLELMDARSDKRLAPNWADSNDSNKSGWTTIEFTGLLDHGAMANADQLHLILLGEGECLVDNVEVIPSGGGNVVANSTFESGTSGWFFQGTHDESYWEPSAGFNSARSLHVVAKARGDTGANRIRTALTTTLGSGSIATLRAKVRWLKGNPEILLRLHGNWLEATANFLTTRSMGTPGARNSQARTNAGPAITQVSHTPVLPAASQTVTVSARVHDPDGLAALFLRYRVDPATNHTSVAMVYNGAGFFSATIPGQPGGTRVAYYLEATDNFSPRANTKFPDDAPVRECLVGFGESTVAGAFGNYRMWITQSTVDKWAAREKNSNKPLDGSFVYGTNRVIYNIRTLYSGSPWHTPGYNSPVGNGCDYVMITPKDDVMLGATDFVLEAPSDDTAQRHQAAFWIVKELSGPYTYRRFVHMFVNGQRRATVFEDAQQPNSDVVEEFFPDDSEGTLHKIEDWFEFDDSGDTRLGNVDATLGNFTTSGGAKKVARYRWCWRPRAVQESANDFTNLFALVDAVNSTQPEPFTRRTEALVNIDSWMRTLAMQRIVGNWDSYGHSRGKNMYAYKPQNDRWVLMSWDIEFVLGSGSNPSDDALFGGNEPYVNAMRNQPSIQRAYWRAFEDAVNGPLLASNIDPMLDSRYSALTANGASVNNPSGIKTYVTERRNFILSQLATVAATFTVNGPTTFTTNRNLITLSGTAPIKVETITVNGVAYRVAWTTVTSWSLRIALSAGTNNLSIQGVDNKGGSVSGATATFAIHYTGANELAQDKLVINEIMYNPETPEASFVEIHNTSVSNAFDLSGWRISGIDCDIPDGTIIEPGAFLVFCEDRFVFASAYSPLIPIAGEFDGNLDNGGETLKLIEPGVTSDQDVIIDQVTYDDDLPWPVGADSGGASLQLIDPTQDNNRVANWAAVPTNAPPPPPQWQYVTASGTASSSTLYMYLQTAGDVYIDDIKLVAGSVPEAGANALPNGDFETAFPGPWGVSPNHAGSVTSSSIKRSGNFSLHVIASSGGTTRASSIYQDITPALATGQPYTLSYWYLPSTNGGPLTLRLSGSGITSTVNISPGGGTNSIRYTPGAINSVRATLPAFPQLWLNEILPHNLNSITDRFGERDPWVEIYNGGTNTVNLTGYSLTDTYTNLGKWVFPANTLISNGQFLLVWLDGEPAESIPTELHTSFRIPTSTGSVALARSTNSQFTLVDHLNYNVSSAGRSYGDYPDGNVSGRLTFSIVTPGATNNADGAAVTVFINEWMADNMATEPDPADGNYEDWFEIFNPSTNAVDLSGYFLTDTLTNRTKWEIPANTIVPPGGHLLVWADEETGQNGPGREPHANFRLSATGEVIGLFSAGGGLIDAVTFPQQTNDVSQGRFGDGQASMYFMPVPTPRAPNYVAQPNIPPVLDTIGNKVANESSLLTFTATATDPNPNQALTFTLEPGAPTNASIHASTGVFNWIPSEEHGPGSYSVTVRVTDNGTPAAMSDTETFAIQVNEVNNAPALAAVSDETINEGSSLNRTNAATDSDTPPQRLIYSLDPTPPAGMSINPTNGVLTWTPAETQGPGTYLITVRVMDDGEPALSDTETLSVFVSEVNAAPVLSPIADRTNYAGTTISFAAIASDDDVPANLLAYSLLAGAPEGASIDASSGAFTWTPTSQQSPSTNAITAQVSDNRAPAGSDSHTFTIVVLSGPRVSEISVSGGVVTISWNSEPNKIYRVQFKNDLHESAWSNLGDEVTAIGSTTSATDESGIHSQRFYRVLQSEQ